MKAECLVCLQYSRPAWVTTGLQSEDEAADTVTRRNLERGTCSETNKHQPMRSGLARYQRRKEAAWKAVLRIKMHNKTVP